MRRCPQTPQGPSNNTVRTPHRKLCLGNHPEPFGINFDQFLDAPEKCNICRCFAYFPWWSNRQPVLGSIPGVDVCIPMPGCGVLPWKSEKGMHLVRLHWLKAWMHSSAGCLAAMKALGGTTKGNRQTRNTIIRIFWVHGKHLQKMYPKGSGGFSSYY